jgi:hypothetical protein
LNALQLLDGMFAADSPRHLVLFRDLQLHLDQSDPMIVRRIKDILRLAKASGHSIILLDFRLKLPPELENEITHVDFRRLDPARLGVVLDGILKSAKLKAPHDAIRETALQSALGLTTTEAENAFALSVVETKGIDHEVVAREKARTLKKNGLVEFVEATTSLDDIGGLGLLKEWLMRRGGAFGASAKTYGLPAPKRPAHCWHPWHRQIADSEGHRRSVRQLPLLRLDMGRVFGGIVGQSEPNLRSVIQTAEAIAPCVLWVAEVEKDLSGSQSSGSTEGGTSSRVLGTFLSWFQDKDKPVFVVATAKDVSKIPPEFLRKGRFCAQRSIWRPEF